MLQIRQTCNLKNIIMTSWINLPYGCSLQNANHGLHCFFCLDIGLVNLVSSLARQTRKHDLQNALKKAYLELEKCLEKTTRHNGWQQAYPGCPRCWFGRQFLHRALLCDRYKLFKDLLYRVGLEFWYEGIFKPIRSGFWLWTDLFLLLNFLLNLIFRGHLRWDISSLILWWRGLFWGLLDPHKVPLFADSVVAFAGRSTIELTEH